MLWLAGAGEVVVLARKENNLGVHAKMFERAIPLFTLLDRDPVIVVGMQNQRRGLHVLRVLQW